MELKGSPGGGPFFVAARAAACCSYATGWASRRDRWGGSAVAAAQRWLGSPSQRVGRWRWVMAKCAEGAALFRSVWRWCVAVGRVSPNRLARLSPGGPMWDISWMRKGVE